METSLSIFFSKLSLPLIEFKIGIIELMYDCKIENIPYPQKAKYPLKHPIKFIKDKQRLAINVKKKIGNKLKILAHGEIIIYKQNLIDGKGMIDKSISLIQTDNNNDLIKINKDNMGKILTKIQLVESYEDWISKIEKKNTSKKNSKICNKKITENKKNYKFEDDLSLLTMTKIQEDENNKFNLEKINSSTEINNLKLLMNNKYQDILPHDIPNLKKLNYDLYEHYKELDTKYKKILSNINNKNDDIISKSKDILNQYNKIKKELFKLRFDYKKRRMNNKDEELQLDNILESNSLIEKKNKLITKVLNKDNGDEKAIISETNYNNNPKDLIVKLYSMGYYLDEELNEEEKVMLYDILKKKNYNKITEKNGSNISKKIVDLIERDVNDLYSRKLIKNMKIDQINSTTYKFSTTDIEKINNFHIENNDLICSNGQKFIIWLVSNFSN